jgi:hypothetical protein
MATIKNFSQFLNESNMNNFGIFAQDLEHYMKGVNFISKNIDAQGVAEFVIKTFSDSHDEQELKNDISDFISQEHLYQNFKVVSATLLKKSTNSREILVKVQL